MNQTDKLIALLRGLPAGPVLEPRASTVRALLATCWPELSGATDTKMASFKVARAEQLAWGPPNLSFAIERHGARQFGSKRAEIQWWTINLETMDAVCTPNAGSRLLEPLAPRLDVRPLAEVIVDALRSGAEHNALVWSRSRNEARLQIGKLIPAASAVKQTLAGRRRRLRTEIEKQARAHGWELLLKGSATWLRRM